MGVEVVEQCLVSPSSAAEKLLPLLFFDIGCLSLEFIESLNFYSFPCSDSLFVETIVPTLKKSLSLTLNHFLPLAGKIIFPLSSGMPVSHYVPGEDSVSLTIARSDAADFAHLTGNHARDADEFHAFLPRVAHADYSSDLIIKLPAAAIQVTLFPDQGICIGFSIHHGICDGSALICFIRTWASINKFNGSDAHLVALGQNGLPFYDRSVVQDAKKLTPIFWNYLKMLRPTTAPSAISSPSLKLRATLILSGAEIQRLKTFVLSKTQSTIHVSSFAVVCGHLWSCFAKLEGAAGDEVADDDEPYYFTCAIDCRARLNPPLPQTYFGNCLAAAVAELTHGRLRGHDGLVAAAGALGEAVGSIINDGRGVLYGSENRLLGRRRLGGKRIASVTGSSRFDLNGSDYGWGELKKAEILHIDHSDRAFSLLKSRGGGVEIGLTMSAARMDAFAAIFNRGLTEAGV